MKEKSLVFDALDRNTAFKVLELAKQIEEPRWSRRTKLDSIRGLEGEICQYDFCGHMQMNKSDKNFLKELAPKYENYFLAEIAINRYRKGDFIGRHRDRHLYRRNLVISLQEDGDGLLIDDVGFLVDKIGQGILFEGIGPVHSVPPVKNYRYSLIYLYE